jgi:hypothetical protein
MDSEQQLQMPLAQNSRLNRQRSGTQGGGSREGKSESALATAINDDITAAATSALFYQVAGSPTHLLQRLDEGQHLCLAHRQAASIAIRFGDPARHVAAGQQRCTEAAIRVYPTWIKGGERRDGVLSLEELQRWSGYRPGGATPVGATPAVTTP